MQRQTHYSLALLLMLVSGGAYAAIGDGKSVVLEKPSQVHPTVAKEAPMQEAQPQAQPVPSQPAVKAPEPKSDNATSVRETTSKVCEQAVDAASLMSEKFTQFSNEILPQLVRTGEEFARQIEPTVRQLEPTMRDFAERMRTLAKQLEQSLGERPTR